MISSNPCRKVMMKVANNGNLTSHEFKELIQQLNSHCPSVIPFLQWISCNYETISDSPRSVKALVRAIAASSPVCGFIKPNENLHCIIRELLDGIDVFACPVKAKTLHEECPILFAALRDLSPSILPRMWHAMFRELLEKSLAPFTNKTPFVPTTPFNREDSRNELSFFPTLPIRRQRNFYIADAARRKEEICTKRHPGHSFFLPGIFTLFCHHGVNYGFEVMQKRESPNVPFSIFFTRFEKAPRIIIYDNACNLHSYCLNRNPEYFKETTFLVDRFHWRNHKGCSGGYNLNLYPHLANINSQVNEQANSTIQRYHTQLSFMTQDNFMNHSRFIMWFMNDKASRRHHFTVS